MVNKKPVLYGTFTSPTVRAVLFTLKALDVDFEFRLVKPSRGQQFTAEYLKMNPAHTIPTLEIDPGQYIGDSHAIMAYLVGRYGKTDDPLYPKDLYKRAKVDQLLHFESSVLFTCVHQALAPIFAGLRDDVPAEQLKEIEKAYNILEAFLQQHAFVAGEQMTIADFSCFSSVTSLFVIMTLDNERHAKIGAWLARIMSLPYYKEIMEKEAMGRTTQFLQKKLNKL